MRKRMCPHTQEFSEVFWDSPWYYAYYLLSGTSEHPGKVINVKFYPQSFVVRLLFCIVTTVLAANLGLFVRDVLLDHGQFAFNAMQGLVLPAALGALASFFWKPKE